MNTEKEAKYIKAIETRDRVIGKLKGQLAFATPQPTPAEALQSALIGGIANAASGDPPGKSWDESMKEAMKYRHSRDTAFPALRSQSAA